MKKFIFKLVLMVFPVLCGLVLINYFGDGAMLFKDNYEKDIAHIINEGQNVTNINNFDERLLQQYLIEENKDCPRVMVTGSSRSMLISADLVDDKSFMNNSVSGASIEDIVGIYQMYKERNQYPDKVIIGVDPWTFNENNNQERWQSISESYYRFHNIVNNEINSDEVEKYKQLISLTYFQSSVKSLPAAIAGTNEPVATADKFNEGNTRLADGSLIYGEHIREATDEVIENKVQSSLEGEMYALEDFNEISEKIWAEFIKLVDDMKKHGVEIEFFLAPYHPDAYKKLEQEYGVAIKAEERLLKFAKIEGIKVYGSFNPDTAGLTEDHFYDSMHCNEKGVALLFKEK